VWTMGESRYSWSDNAALNADYDAAKGNDDIWELELREIVSPTGATTEPKWTRRAVSLYASLCSGEWTSGEWMCRLHGDNAYTLHSTMFHVLCMPDSCWCVLDDASSRTHHAFQPTRPTPFHRTPHAGVH